MAIVAGKLGIQKLVTQTQSLGEFDIDTDGKIKFTTVNAGPTFTIEVKGRIAEQKFFTHIADIVGSADHVVDVVQWDFLQINVTVYDSTSNHVKLDASGFNIEVVALQSISVPSGTNLTDVSDLIFTSSDSTVTITGNSATNTIDLTTVGGGVTTKYVQAVIIGDWVLSSGEYLLVIPYSTHNIPNPIVTCYESNGASFNEILIPVDISASETITLSVPQIPDARFIGKIVIE